MSTAIITAPAALQLQPLTSKATSTTTVSETTSLSIRTIDELLVNRAQTNPDVPLVAYPPAGSRADYLHYTAKDLDLFADECAKYFVQRGLSLKVS
jgi:hypothetical protein